MKEIGEVDGVKGVPSYRIGLTRSVKYRGIGKLYTLAALSFTHLENGSHLL